MPRRKVPIRQSELVQRFAARLREVRLLRGLTQAELSRTAQVTVSYISRLEGGRVAPGIDMVERVAAALGTAVNDLLPTSESPDPLPVLKGQAERMLGTLLEQGDRATFLRLNPLLALLVEDATRRG